MALLASESEGLARVISAPRVQTQDNIAAEIQSGTQIPFQTRINFTTTIDYIDATLRLSVTPQITEAGTVIMTIALQKTDPQPGLIIAGAAGTPLSTRQAKTTLMVRDGGTAVIGGIYETTENRAETRMPFLHSIPVLGALFRTHDINNEFDELLIFITPRIVRAG
jgi:type IV pilus assembly protein PilQ